MQVYEIGGDELDELAGPWDAAVDASDGVDQFCTSSLWSFPASASFPEAGPPTVLTDGASFAGVRTARAADGTRLLVGLDPIWGFATPVIGHPIIANRMLLELLSRASFDIAVITGQREDLVLTAYLVQMLEDHFTLFRGASELRLRAELGGGFDAWFARRSSRFRQRMRSIERGAEEAGIDVVDVSALPPEDVIARILSVEERSWKGQEETGLASPSLADFYRRMIWRLAASDQLRLLVARKDDVDVGFILGGVRGATYRGLQLSHDVRFHDHGIGHLLQLHQIRHLDGTGIEVYDLGMDMDYKRRWADRVDESFAVLARPDSSRHRRVSSQ